MGSIVFLVLSGPYTFQNSHTLVSLANAIIEKGHEIKSIFFFADGVYNVNKYIKVEEGNIDIPRELEKLAAKGVEIAVCSACADYRGINDENLVNGVEIAGIATLGEYFEEADKVIVFGM